MLKNIRLEFPETFSLEFPNNNVSVRRFSFQCAMINLRRTVQASLAQAHKVIVIQKKVSLCLNIKSTITEWIKSFLKVVFKFMCLKTTKRHSEPA